MARQDQGREGSYRVNWLAYQSNESGLSEIFVRPFPALDSGRWPVSTHGGTRPLWSRDGKEIFISTRATP